MASETRTLPSPGARQSSELRQVAKIAEQRDLLEAQHWFARERQWILEQQLALCRIPAPTFFERQRAEWFCARLTELGWQSRIDRAGNVLANRATARAGNRLIVSAHLDTVFAPKRTEDVYLAGDGRLVGPGVSDNGSGLSALLALARMADELPALHELASNLLLVANVGEEGEGNLSGMRYLCSQLADAENVAAFIVLDGPSTDHITAQALASRRFEIALSGPGGHSWNDYGTPNPVHALSDFISYFRQMAEVRLTSERGIRCSFNFGILEGGTSINSIPSYARAKLDLRSEQPTLLEDLGTLLTSALERILERENRQVRGARLTAKIRELGTRPGGRLADNSPLLRAIQSVDAFLGLRSRVDCASTDANVPLSLGLPAISIGTGGQGGGAHTENEWYQPDNRESGLRRILLLLACIHSWPGDRTNTSDLS